MAPGIVGEDEKAESVLCFREEGEGRREELHVKADGVVCEENAFVVASNSVEAAEAELFTGQESVGCSL